MKQFNKYQFIKEFNESLKDEFKEYIENNEYLPFDEFNDIIYNDFLSYYISNETIYTAVCWGICSQLASSDFEISYSGERAKNIQELAFFCLEELIQQENICEEFYTNNLDKVKNI